MRHRPFDQIVTEFGPVVLRVCRSVLSAADADDAWSETFLAALPDKQRRAVAYHYLAGLPYAQVAELLGNSEAAARRAAADGIGALRHRLAAASLESSEGPR